MTEKAAAEALEWAVDQTMRQWPESAWDAVNAYVRDLNNRIAELRAQAEQPAEPVALTMAVREVCQVLNQSPSECALDPRIAKLEGLLREAHETLSSGLESDSELEHEWSKADRELCERIAAALKGG